MHPSLSTDQVAALVELARQGSIRAAAHTLHITEQGVRNRLLTLEKRLGVELYRKERGVRRTSALTRAGQDFLPHALAFMEQAADLVQLFGEDRQRVIHVVATEYLILYLLIDAVRRFHRRFPGIRARLSSHSEQEIEHLLLADPEIALGVAAPYEPSPLLEYRHLFSMNWSLVTPPRHALSKPKEPQLPDLVDAPLILFERGSTGRQHVLDAFHGLGLSPRVDMEATSTEIIVRMVEAGLGVAIVPLLPSGVVTRGRRVTIRGLGQQIRPIHSGILVRRADPPSAAVNAFVDFLLPGASRGERGRL